MTLNINMKAYKYNKHRDSFLVIAIFNHILDAYFIQLLIQYT